MIGGTSLEKEIDVILNESYEETFPAVSVTVHTNDEDLQVSQLLTIDIKRDFKNALTDIITLEFLLPLGDYVHIIHSNKNRLEATLCMEKYYKQNCRRYKAIVLNADSNSTNSKMNAVDQDDLNKTNFVTVTLQLVPVELMLLKKLKHEGIYRNSTAYDVLLQSIIYEVAKLKLYGTFFNINLNAYKSEFTTKYENIIIPRGTKLGKILTLLQEKYGYYSFSGNAYFQLDNEIKKNLYLWIYPTVDFERVTKDSNIGMLYNTIKKGSSTSEKSYWKKNHQLKLVTDTVKIHGGNHNSLFDKGKGLSFQKATDNLSSYNYDINKDEDNYTTNKDIMVIKDNDGMDNTTDAGILDNIHKLNSALNVNKLSYIETTIYNFTGLWDNGPLEQLIYPGMPFYYIYSAEKNGLSKTMKLPGTIIEQNIHFDIKQKTMSSSLLLGVMKPSMTKGE